MDATMKRQIINWHKSTIENLEDIKQTDSSLSEVQKDAIDTVVEVLETRVNSLKGN
jgi:hypothetical protein